MARVPTPVTQGAQQLGGVKPIAADTPFQNLKAPRLDGPAKVLKQFGATFQDASDAALDMMRTNDKRELANAETEMTTALALQRQELEALQGQERLDAMQPKGHPGLVGAGDTAHAKAERDLERISQTYADKLSGAGKAALAASMKQLQAQHTIDLNDQRIKAQAQADAKTITTRVATMSTNAEGAIGTQQFDRVMTNSLNGAKAAVTDPDIGLAKQAGVTDPAQIDLMVKSQQAVVVDHVATVMLSQGRLEEAASLIDLHTGDGGTLTGTAQSAQLQAKIAPYRDTIKGRKEFSVLTEKTGTNPAALQTAIYNEKDVQKRARLQAEFNKFSAATSAQRTEAVSNEITNAFTKLAQGGQVTPQDIPTFMQDNPQAAHSLLFGRQQALRQQVDVSQAQQKHSDRGGGEPNTAMDTFMGTLKQTRPQEYVDIIESPHFYKFVGKEQLDAFRDGAILVQKDIDEGKGQPRYNLVTQLKQMQFSNKEAGRVAGEHGLALTKQINDARSKAAAEGKVLRPDDINKVLAPFLIQIRSEEGWATLPFVGEIGESYDYSVAVSQGIANNDAILTDTTRNKIILATAFGLPLAALEGQIDEGMTVSELAGKLGVKTPMELDQAVAMHERNVLLANKSGYAWEFVEWAASADPNYDHSNHYVSSLLSNWAKTPEKVRDIYNAWLAGER